MISILFAVCAFACSPSIDLTAWAEGNTLWVEAGADVVYDFADSGMTNEEIKFALKHPPYLPENEHLIFVVNVTRSNGRAMQKLLRVERRGWNKVVFPILHDGSEYYRISFGGWNMMSDAYYRFNGGQWEEKFFDYASSVSVRQTRDKAIEAENEQERAEIKSWKSPAVGQTKGWGFWLAILGVLSACIILWVSRNKKRRKR